MKSLYEIQKYGVVAKIQLEGKNHDEILANLKTLIKHDTAFRYVESWDEGGGGCGLYMPTLNLTTEKPSKRYF